MTEEDSGEQPRTCRDCGYLIQPDEEHESNNCIPILRARLVEQNDYLKSRAGLVTQLEGQLQQAETKLKELEKRLKERFEERQEAVTLSNEVIGSETQLLEKVAEQAKTIEALADCLKEFSGPDEEDSWHDCQGTGGSETEIPCGACKEAWQLLKEVGT